MGYEEVFRVKIGEKRLEVSQEQRALPNSKIGEECRITSHKIYEPLQPPDQTLSDLRE